MGFARGYKKALELKKENEEIEVTISYGDGEGQKQTEQIQLPADSTVITVSEAAALEIARQAFAQEYALTGAQLDQMEYNKDTPDTPARFAMVRRCTSCISGCIRLRKFTTRRATGFTVRSWMRRPAR
jgi:hypothetical protein